MTVLVNAAPREVESGATVQVLVKDLGLNTIRLEGKLESDDFFAKADAYGLLVMPGWMCCDRWQESKSWSKAEHGVALAAMATQARRLRSVSRTFNEIRLVDTK